MNRFRYLVVEGPIGVGKTSLALQVAHDLHDAFIDGEQVGYLRLRHGYFTVQYPNVSGELVYSAEPNGDGIFEYEEREGYLAAARLAIINKHWEKINE